MSTIEIDYADTRKVKGTLSDALQELATDYRQASQRFNNIHVAAVLVPIGSMTVKQQEDFAQSVPRALWVRHDWTGWGSASQSVQGVLPNTTIKLCDADGTTRSTIVMLNGV